MTYSKGRGGQGQKNGHLIMKSNLFIGRSPCVFSNGLWTLIETFNYPIL